MMEAIQDDNSVMGKLFAHNLWATLSLLDFCEALTDEQMDSSAIGGYGTIRETLAHYITSEVYYVEQVNQKLPPDVPVRNEFKSFALMRASATWAAAELLELAVTAREDMIVRLRPPRKVYEYPLTGLMMQVLSHSTEHRTQIATIITQLGMEPPDISGWRYMADRGEFYPL